MEEYKILHNGNNIETIQEMFEKLGYKKGCINKNHNWIVTTEYGSSTNCGDLYSNINDCELLTMRQLRQMVAEKQTQMLKDNGYFAEVNLEKSLPNGLLTPQQAKLAWANGEELQWRDENFTEWMNLNSDFRLSIFDDAEFRLKPRTITINNIEIPAPFEPKVGEVFFVLYPTAVGGYSKMHITDQKRMDDYAKLGAWRTESEIKQVVAALRSILCQSK